MDHEKPIEKIELPSHLKADPSDSPDFNIGILHSKICDIKPGHKIPEIISKNPILYAQNPHLFSPDSKIFSENPEIYSEPNNLSSSDEAVDLGDLIISFKDDTEELRSPTISPPEKHEIPYVSDPRLNFSSPTDADTCLRVADRKFFVWKSILEKKSPFFKVMFSRNWKEHLLSKNGEPIEISGISENDFRSLLHFLYTNKVLFFPAPCGIWENFKMFRYFLEIGNYFGVSEDMESVLCINLSKILDYGSVFSIWRKSHLLELECFASVCEKFLIRNFYFSSQTNEFLLSEKELLRRVLRSGEIEDPADEILEKLKVWAVYNIRRDALESGKIGKGNMGDMDVRVKDYLEGLLPPETLFSRELKCRVLNLGRM